MPFYYEEYKGINSNRQTSQSQRAPVIRVHLITIGHPKIHQARYMVMFIK